jgi:hypothetical protein
VSRLLVGGFLTVVLAEVVGVLLGWGWALPLAGVGLVVFAVQLTLRLDPRGEGPVPAPDTASESLQRWRAQTEELVRWADGTRGDWDRHLRPKLARDFLLATRQKDPAGVDATGLLVFGDDLWQWVDPQNVSPGRRGEPAPGRDALDQILQRLEHA